MVDGSKLVWTRFIAGTTSECYQSVEGLWILRTGRPGPTARAHKSAFDFTSSTILEACYRRLGTHVLAPGILSDIYCSLQTARTSILGYMALEECTFFRILNFVRKILPFR